MTPADSEGAPGAARRVSDGSAVDILEGRVSVVDEVSDALALAAGLRQRLERVLDVLERRFDVARAVVYAVDAGARQLEIVASHGLGAQHYRPRVGAGVVGRAAQSKQRIVVPEVRLEPMALSELTHPEDWTDEGWSQAAVPLLAGKTLTGVLAAGWMTTAGLAIKARHDRNIIERPGTPPQQIDDAQRLHRTLAIVSDVLLASTLVSGGVSAYLTWWPRSGPSASNGAGGSSSAPAFGDAWTVGVFGQF